MPKKNYFISFIGGIGAGKTTAMELVASALGFKSVREQYSQNPFLPLFYKNMKRWAMHSQLFFLSEKISQLLEIKEMLAKESIALDVDIRQDMNYLEAQKERGIISADERALYYKIYRGVEKFLPKPNLIVYLKSNPVILRQRIKERGRSFERGMTLAYLRSLVGAQEHWLRRNRGKLPILIIDSDKLNFANHDPHKQEFIDEIKKRLL
ncbi:MAG: deoxynucleoside kinase [Candidatus Nealsonbacteria bacterium]|nr:deoxynucleoside kinase [Candidatus Nealsonbacteria bacterium]